MEEHELIERIRQGDAQAFESFVLAFQERILNTCYRFVNNVQDAEDIAQNVFLEVYQSIHEFRGQSSLSTWTYRIATTKSLDYVRRMNRKKRLGHLKRLFLPKNQENQTSFEPEDSSTPAHTLEQTEQSALLNQAVAALPDNQRVAITLNKYEELSYTEVAEIMKTTVSAVESLIHRAKKNLQKRLYRYYDENLEK